MLRDLLVIIFFSSRRRHTRLQGDWSSDVCASDLGFEANAAHMVRWRHGGDRHRGRKRQRIPPQKVGADRNNSSRRSDDLSDRVVGELAAQDRKSTRLNSSHLVISYAVFCLKKKKTTS